MHQPRSEHGHRGRLVGGAQRTEALPTGGERAREGRSRSALRSKTGAGNGCCAEPPGIPGAACARRAHARAHAGVGGSVRGSSQGRCVTPHRHARDARGKFGSHVGGLLARDAVHAAPPRLVAERAAQLDGAEAQLAEVDHLLAGCATHVSRNGKSSAASCTRRVPLRAACRCALRRAAQLHAMQRS